MAQKNNIRSIRFSDELAELIDRQAGRSFTEKFENLITRCVWELPAKEAELQRIQDQIDRKRKNLADINSRCRELEYRIVQTSQDLQSFCSAMNRSTKSLELLIDQDCNTD